MAGRLRQGIRQAAREERRHRRTFEGTYNKTPQEMHAEVAFPKSAKCKCGRRPITRAITFAPFEDAAKHWPELVGVDPNVVLQRVVQIKENPTDKDGKPYVRLGVAYACESCTPAMETALAKLPSWVLVEINRGPTTKKVVGLS